MKQIIKIIFLVIFVMMFMMACSKDNDVIDSKDIIWGAELVNVNVNVSVNQTRGFNIPFAYKEKKDEIQFVNVSGVNEEAISIELVDDTLDVFKDVKYKGYKFGYLEAVSGSKKIF